ncbi:hypothetical protein T4D_8268, partial [Trichinella pseudospiralis]
MERTLLKAFMVSYSLNAITARAEHHSVLSFSFRPSCYIQHCANIYTKDMNCITSGTVLEKLQKTKQLFINYIPISKKHQILHEDSSIKPSKPLIIAFSFEISIFALSGDYFKIWE